MYIFFLLILLFYFLLYAALGETYSPKRVTNLFKLMPFCEKFHSFIGLRHRFKTCILHYREGARGSVVPFLVMRLYPLHKQEEVKRFRMLLLQVSSPIFSVDDSILVKYCQHFAFFSGSLRSP